MKNYFIIGSIVALAGLAVASSSVTADAGTSLTAIGSRAQIAQCLSTGGKIWTDQNSKKWCSRYTSDFSTSPVTSGQQQSGCNSLTGAGCVTTYQQPHF
jgi:hypothetical protein